MCHLGRWFRGGWAVSWTGWSGKPLATLIILGFCKTNKEKVGKQLFENGF